MQNDFVSSFKSAPWILTLLHSAINNGIALKDIGVGCLVDEKGSVYFGLKFWW